MPINFRIDYALGLVVTKFEGIVDRADADALVDNLRADPDFRPSFD